MRKSKVHNVFRAQQNYALRFALDVLTLILLFLIKIGDGVIFLAKVPFSLFILLLRKIRTIKIKSQWQKVVPFLYIVRLFLSLFSLGVKNRLKTFLLVVKTIIKTPFKLIGRIRIPKRKKIRPRKIRAEKPIVVFSVPILTRFKYFFSGVLFSFLFIFVPILFLIFLQDLPNPKSITLVQPAQTTKIYDRNGTLLFQIYANQNRTIVPLSEVPLSLRQATIAIEDRDFYTHPGFDMVAITRSFWANVSGKDLQGGSTITQQLIKSTLLTPETNLSRKLKEVILAFWAERIYTKNQILELYFNQVPYGGTAWGVEAAAETYFGKHAKELDLAQSAFLAGIPQAPTVYSPYSSTTNTWKKRQTEVLDRMVTLGYISQKQANSAKDEELTFLSPQNPIYAPHFVMYVKDYLAQKYGLEMVEKGGLTVTTTIDLRMQDMAQKIVTDEVINDGYLNLTNGASLITNPKNGDILAMVGSKDFSEPQSGNVNLTTRLRQPGSSIKIVTYAAALSNGYTAASIIDDSPSTFGTGGGPAYIPVNYDGKFHGPLPLRMALANSLNIPAVKTLNSIGIDTMVNQARKMGVRHWGESSQYGLSITLGAAEVNMLDMATIFGTLANTGNRVDLNPILKITDSKGNILEDKLAASNKASIFAADKAEGVGQRVLDEGVAYVLTDILADNGARAMEFGPISPLNIPGHYVSVKTGTSDNKRDNWTIGYTSDYVVTVWVGNNDNTPMSPTLASGITGAAPIWNKIFTNLLQATPEQRPQPPASVVAKPCLGRIEYFVRGTENSVNCNFVPPKKFNPSKAPEPTKNP